MIWPAAVAAVPLHAVMIGVIPVGPVVIVVPMPVLIVMVVVPIHAMVVMLRGWLFEVPNLPPLLVLLMR